MQPTCPKPGDKRKPLAQARNDVIDRLLQLACGCPDRVDAPQRGRVLINELKDFLKSVDVRHHGEPLDLAAGVGLQEGVVVLERHAAVGIAVRAEQVGVGEKATTAKHL